MIGHDYRPNKKISLIGLTHTLELRVALTHNNKKNFCFQLNYRQLPPLSAPNPSCSYSFTQLIDQNDLLSAKQQPYVRGRIFARSSTISSARNSSGVFLAQMDIHIHVWNIVEVMRRDFNDYHITQVPMIENQFGEMQMMKGWRKWLSMWE